MVTKDIKNQILAKLKTFKALKVYMINKKELKDHGIDQIFPRLHNNDKEKEMEFHQIYKVLNEILTDTERLIIEHKYLKSSRMNDQSVYLEIGLKKDKYYKIKKQALTKLSKHLFSQY